ncbi:DUF4386 domain-containing protein [Paraconexibacter algicola]|uniref:DUF4386 family protein n=1 Tax=Paraconexibacter algicola TaxID=2133960 RepID=A0A2T4UK27_9ACTN|nr:DUF4386 domain-containing protein [Paraconexibacter algicola]PTL59557.1 hypothetical protein C7Y72_07800 [Paraconexibacter algicola]
MAKLTIRDEDEKPEPPRRRPKKEAPKPADIPPVDTAREARWGRVAGVAAIGSVLATMAALLIQGSSIPNRAGREANDRTTLFDVGEGGDGLVVSTFLQSASLLLIIVVAWFLYRATKDRNPATSVWIPRAGTVGFIVAAVIGVLGFYEVRDVADQYLGSGARTLDRAETLLDDARDGALGTINLLTVFGALVSGIWLSLCSLEAGRVGLLTRFLGIFGVGAGLATAIPGLGIGPYLLLGWLGSVGCLALGYWPGGRPPAWDAGRAVPWEEADALERDARVARREERSRS